ncbi:HalOD1 output domain-containing protein [Natronococcus occultus]|uniref:Halobacterial output domain-containing protein n=1 Tax=Natronococcus occultus SP4 TaxID=694430 RepID=L0K214_9EURY|nr:HalOD1 output domain-containing protein [Natronococcus occultus]AGB38600.1 hypothetical protein Natoc_2841 [Natronococcus occultus SP4]
MTETSLPDRNEPPGSTSESELTTEIVYAVARVSDTDPTALPPLYDVIDTDALNALVGCSRSTLDSITFRYYGYTVTVTADGDVTVASTT